MFVYLFFFLRQMIKLQFSAATTDFSQSLVGGGDMQQIRSAALFTQL